jgi:hypothetical protein
MTPASAVRLSFVSQKFESVGAWVALILGGVEVKKRKDTGWKGGIDGRRSV